MNLKDRDLVLFLRTEESDHGEGRVFFMLKAMVQEIEHENGEPRFRGCDSYSRLGYDDLGAYAQCENDGTSPSYAWDVEYFEPYTVNAHRAGIMAKTLRAIHAKLDRFTRAEGRPESFGAYCARLARAIGAKAIITKRFTGPSATREYRYWTIGEGVDAINQTIRDFKRAYHPDSEVAA